jgi:hypothetical protein
MRVVSRVCPLSGPEILCVNVHMCDKENRKISWDEKRTKQEEEKTACVRVHAREGADGGIRCKLGSKKAHSFH